jgi:hypothetical protein
MMQGLWQVKWAGRRTGLLRARPASRLNMELIMPPLGAPPVEVSAAPSTSPCPAPGTSSFSSACEQRPTGGFEGFRVFKPKVKNQTNTDT